MKKGNKLYRLIATLNKAEKRHFHLYANAFQKKTKNNDYLKLYQLIEENNVQDDTALEKLLKKGQFKNLSSLKGYLYKKILDSLVINSTNEFDALYKEFLNIRQLIKKKLYKDALQAIASLQQKRKSLNTYVTELDALYQQQKVQRLLMTSDKELEVKAFGVLPKIASFLEAQMIQVQYFMLNEEVYNLAHNVKMEGPIKKMEDYLEHPLLKDRTHLKNVVCTSVNQIVAYKNILYLSFLKPFINNM